MLARRAVRLAAGALHCPRTRVRSLDAVAATLWAGTAAMIGYVGGTAFAGRPLIAVAVALTVGAVVMGLVELAGRRTMAAAGFVLYGGRRDDRGG